MAYDKKNLKCVICNFLFRIQPGCCCNSETMLVYRFKCPHLSVIMSHAIAKFLLISMPI